MIFNIYSFKHVKNLIKYMLKIIMNIRDSLVRFKSITIIHSFTIYKI